MIDWNLLSCSNKTCEGICSLGVCTASDVWSNKSVRWWLLHEKSRLLLSSSVVVLPVVDILLKEHASKNDLAWHWLSQFVKELQIEITFTICILGSNRAEWNDHIVGSVVELYFERVRPKISIVWAAEVQLAHPANARHACKSGHTSVIQIVHNLVPVIRRKPNTFKVGRNHSILGNRSKSKLVEESCWRSLVHKSHDTETNRLKGISSITESIDLNFTWWVRGINVLVISFTNEDLRCVRNRFSASEWLINYWTWLKWPSRGNICSWWEFSYCCWSVSQRNWPCGDCRTEVPTVSIYLLNNKWRLSWGDCSSVCEVQGNSASDCSSESLKTTSI